MVRFQLVGHVLTNRLGQELSLLLLAQRFEVLRAVQILVYGHHWQRSR